MKRKNEKGFTLVEVIVVAVIVAVLAAVAIPLYIGYINDANRNAAQNAAGAAASFLAAARNAQYNGTLTLNGNSGAVTSFTLPSGQVVNYQVPEGVTITVTGNSVRATKGTQNSDNFNF